MAVVAFRGLYKNGSLTPDRMGTRVGVESAAERGFSIGNLAGDRLHGHQQGVSNGGY